MQTTRSSDGALSAFQARANRLFDRLLRVEVGFLGRRESAFLACGKVGLLMAVALGIVLTLHRGLSLPVILALSATSVAALLGQTLIMKVLTGEEELVYYRHEIAIIVVAALTLWLLDQPVWPYLDITILAVGIFLVCGRVGCLMVGCCHGRPHRWGARYSPEHAAAGFTSHYVGIRLFPIQIVESAWVLATVAVGAGMIVGGSAPGEAFAWYVIVYDIGRFSFEFVRGDPGRPYIKGFSEAQWTSVLLMVVILIAEAYGVLPFHAWHWLATGAVAAALIAVAWMRPASGLARHRILHPRHVREVAEALEGMDPAAGAPTAEGTIVLVASTSLGLRLSTGTTNDPAGPVRHYTISWSGGDISAEAARTLADLVLLLKHVSTPSVLTKGSTGAFHLLIGPAGG
jgi:hypothetical protein